MKGNNMKSSFAIPEEMQEAIQASKDKKKVKEEPVEEVFDSESIPEEVEKKVEKEGEEKPLTREEELELQKKDEKEIAEKIKKEMKFELTEDDMWKYYFGTMTKVVTIIPGKVEAVFSTITMDDNDLVTEATSAAAEKNILEIGIQSATVKNTLAAGLLKLGKPGAPRPIGETFEERLKAIGGMNTMMVDILIKKWNQFIFTCRIESDGDKDLKN